MEVKSNSQGSDLVDPFDVDDEYSSSLLALFPTTVKYSSSSLLPNRDSSNFDFLPDHFKARVFSNCDNWLKQGKAILEGSVDQLEFGKTAAVSMENEKVTRGKRPALGIQRAKFSLKPMPSQPAVGMDFNIDIDKLSDPEEFFAAFDRMENAKKEVRRLRGEPLLDLDQNRPSLAPRQRRPSILGRTATYKHRPHSIISEANINETSLPSQVTFDDDILSPNSNNNVPDASVMDESPSMRVTDSKSMTTRRVSELDELLSSNFEGLDEDGVQKLLQDKLQIKPVDIGKAFLPNWRVQLPRSLISTSSLSNDTVFCLSGAGKAVRNRDPRSPKKSKSPLASISLLNRNIAKLSPSKDPFSILNIDLSPTEATDPAREPEKRVDQGEQSDEVDARNNLSESRRSPAHGVENIAVSRENSIVSAMNDVDPISEPKEKENVVGEFNQLDMMDLPEFGRSPENEENITVSGERSLDLISKDVGPTSESEMQEDEVAAARLSARHRLIFESLDMNTSSAGVENGRTNEQSDTENISVEELSKGADGASKGKRKEKERSMEPSEAVVSKETVKKGRLTKTSQTDAPVSGGTRSKRRDVEGAQPGRSKGELRRFSLYNAGTKWEAGLRRSTRIRMKPLQYWKGERFLYGRVNQSLVTVIGVKYACPSEDKKEKFQVKSFVSDEHKDLVESASFY